MKLLKSANFLQKGDSGQLIASSLLRSNRFRRSADNLIYKKKIPSAQVHLSLTRNDGASAGLKIKPKCEN